MLELGKAVSLLLSIVSLWWLMASAFFVPGTRWEDRIAMALLHAVVAACICFASGMIFRSDEPLSESEPQPGSHTLTHTLPVQLFLWSLAGITVMFLLSWYLSVYYVPMLWKNQPY